MYLAFLTLGCALICWRNAHLRKLGSRRHHRSDYGVRHLLPVRDTPRA